MTQVRQSPQTVQNVVTYDVVVGVDNSDLSLIPGMTASTQIIIDQRNDVLRVPNQALRYVPGGLSAVGSRGHSHADEQTAESLGVARWSAGCGHRRYRSNDDNFTEIV